MDAEDDGVEDDEGGDDNDEDEDENWRWGGWGGDRDASSPCGNAAAICRS